MTDDPNASIPPPFEGCEMAQTYTSLGLRKIGGHTNTSRIDFRTAPLSSAATATGPSTTAPLLANFDEFGKYEPEFSVLLPSPAPRPPSTPTSSSRASPPAGEANLPAANLAQLGQAMTSDEEVLQSAPSPASGTMPCPRAMSSSTPPLSRPKVIAPLVQKFKASGYNLNATWRDVFLHDDFVRF
ncbi:MAG: hypothetical protein R3B70_30315 [Polyangiaceae bacterium]